MSVPIPTDFYKRYYFEQNILQPRRYNYLPFLKMNTNLFLIKDVEEARTVTARVKMNQHHRRFIQNILAKERNMLI